MNLRIQLEKHNSPVYKAAMTMLITYWHRCLLSILYLHLAGLKSLAWTNL